MLSNPSLSEILRDAGFAPKGVKLLRHDYTGNAAWREGRDEFLSFASIQSLASSPFKRDPKYVAHFLSGPKLPSGGYGAIFVGMTKLLGRWPWDDVRLPSTWTKDFRTPGATAEAADQAWVDTPSPLSPGLVIDWGVSVRSWHQWGDGAKPVVFAPEQALDREAIAQYLGAGLLAEEDKQRETLDYEARAIKQQIARNTEALNRAFEERRLGIVQVRPNQARFRAELIRRHREICAVTQCDVGYALEACHIIPFAEGTSERDMPSNGLLLRRDIHRLFDLLVLSVDPETWTVWLSHDLRGGFYRDLHDAALVVDAAKPALDEHFRRARAACAAL